MRRSFKNHEFIVLSFLVNGCGRINYKGFVLQNCKRIGLLIFRLYVFLNAVVYG